MSIKQGILLCVSFLAPFFARLVFADDFSPLTEPAVRQPGGKPPDGYRLQETRICMEERRNGPYGRPLPVKRFSIAVATWVPIDNCLQLGADGKLTAVSGDCQVNPPAVESCE